MKRADEGRAPEYLERAALLGPRSLVGVITEPQDLAPVEAPWVVVLNAGIAPRMGPGRLGVRLARRAAAAGFAALRFDHGGLGDSPGRWVPGRSRDQAVDELGEVLDALAHEHGARSFVLIGLCSGAATALARAEQDARVSAIALLNPRGLSPDPAWNDEALNVGWTRNYFERSLFSADSWRRALTGRIGYRRLATVLATAVRRRFAPSRRAVAVDRELAERLDRILARGVRLLLALSVGDHAEDYLERVLARPIAGGELRTRVERVDVAGADHTFTTRANQAPLLARLEDWLAGQKSGRSATETGSERQA